MRNNREAGFTPLELIQARQKIAALQQELSDCKSSLRAVEAERDRLVEKGLDLIDEREHWKKEAYGYNWQKAKAEAADVREKQLRAALLDARPLVVRSGCSAILDHIDRALASKEGGK